MKMLRIATELGIAAMILLLSGCSRPGPSMRPFDQIVKFHIVTNLDSTYQVAYWGSDSTNWQYGPILRDYATAETMMANTRAAMYQKYLKAKEDKERMGKGLR